ncbi:FISUMP domain-containing protein [Pseudorhodobacter sp. E13]|uniref:FISUMP domain-containing protein n=1 Tax=Pseudorhodobacter sp. E13 TaxID=2487931 RepID=UPI0013150E79|nr:FISUMP domain-containing protein [Pseudorhodobacter sp. E13]
MTEITTEQGNTYRLVEIGNQCWFADNLKEIPTTDKGWYGNYAGKNGVKEKSHYLYSWDSLGLIQNNNSICPNGWRIPSRCDIIKLEIGLGAIPFHAGENSDVDISKKSTLYFSPQVGGVGSLREEGPIFFGSANLSFWSSDSINNYAVAFQIDDNVLEAKKFTTKHSNLHPAKCVKF